MHGEKLDKKRAKRVKKNRKKSEKKGGSKYRHQKKSIPVFKLEEDNPLILMRNFWDNINIHLADQTVRKYFAILGIDSKKFVDEWSRDFYNWSYRMVKMFLKYPTIAHEIYLYIATKKSKLEFLDNFSIEQIKYITNPSICDTKLIATAGSGKTRSIIGRIKFIVEHRLIRKENVFAMTFSNHAASDFHSKIMNLFPNFNEFCKLKNFSTIDSLAKSILCRVKSHKSDNVEILSIALRNYLKNMPPDDANVITNNKNIRHIFVDEAQDLNEVQYDIIVLLKEKFGTTAELIGDPNQNIYQFRRSSSSYLMNFEGKHYELTQNFRSTQEIVNFSEGLKPIATSLAISASKKNGPKPTIITDSANNVHKFLLNFIAWYGKDNDLSNIAVVCPTRGIGVYENVGLSVIFNLFKINNIPFKQLYNESGNNNEKKRDVKKTPGHINLLTYHGTKGLEFDVVFVMDFYQFLFNIKPTEDEHKIAQYLLYVICSRAISMMFICTYTNVHGGYLNHWITNINSIHFDHKQPLKIPHLTFREKKSGGAMTGITDIIVEMNDEELDRIHDILEIIEDKNIFTRRIYRDFTHIDRGNDETLFGIFCEELFYLQYHLSREMRPRTLLKIKQIIDSNFIIIDDDSDCKALKSYLSYNKLTWKKYDKTKNFMQERISSLIEKYFSRDKEIHEFMVCTNEFKKIVEENQDDIKKTYEYYLTPDKYNFSYKKILNDFFYLVVVMYAYEIHHYYYIHDHGREKAALLKNGSALYEEMDKYISTHYWTCDLDIKYNVHYKKLMLCGEIDFIERYYGFGSSPIYPSIKNVPKHIDRKTGRCSQTIVEIKCTNDISIKYYIQLLLYNFCYYYKKKEYDKLFDSKFKIINLLTGLEHSIIIRVSPTNMFNLLITIAHSGNLVFNNMNLVYDLETNNQIEIRGPYKYEPTIPRSIVTKVDNQYYARVFPEIIEISIKDYETEMVLLNTLVKPEKSIPAFIQELTHINPLMLVNKPKIAVIKKVLEYKMRNFINCKLLAHNGNKFDNQIMLYEKLLDTQKVSFLDTLSIIPIHLPNGMKLKSKSLGKIYYELFKEEFNAHRAMADVDALIKIMKYLKIEF